MPSDLPTPPTPEGATILPVDAELAEARQRREDLDAAWGRAMYTAGCRRPRRPKDIAAALARVDAEIAEIERRREALALARVAADVADLDDRRT